MSREKKDKTPGNETSYDGWVIQFVANGKNGYSQSNGRAEAICNIRGCSCILVSLKEEDYFLDDKNN